MEKKIRKVISIAALLSLFLPINESWPFAVSLYITMGTVMAVFQVIPEIIWSISSAFLDLEPFFLLDALYLFALLGWAYAIPLLLAWNVYMAKHRETRLKKIYYVWLLLSLVSSITYGDIPSLISSQKWSYFRNIGALLNPALLFIAIGAEIWLWFTERRMKALE